MSGYRISLVVPIYGVEKYIRQFAESALGQTYQDLQFVFVNDGRYIFLYADCSDRTLVHTHQAKGASADYFVVGSHRKPPPFFAFSIAFR